MGSASAGRRNAGHELVQNRHDIPVGMLDGEGPGLLDAATKRVRKGVTNFANIRGERKARC